MSDENQTFVPASFVDLHRRVGQAKLSLPLLEIASRHELCEDLAQLLTETASSLFHTLHVTEGDVLRRCLAGLRSEDSVVSADEALWVTRRLAELMNWAPLPAEPQA